MTLKEFMDLGLNEEQAKACAKASQKELESYVSRIDHDVVVKERDSAQATVKERDSQLAELKKATGDVDKLNEKIEALQAENKAKDKEHAEEIKKLKVDSAVESALVTNGAKNMKAVRALLDIDMDKVKVTKDGSLEGLDIDEQIENLKKAEDSSFMFKENRFKGANPSNPEEKNDDAGLSPKDMTYDQLVTYLDENPGATL